jgi:hypothetical protein
MAQRLHVDSMFRRNKWIVSNGEGFTNRLVPRPKALSHKFKLLDLLPSHTSSNQFALAGAQQHVGCYATMWQCDVTGTSRD